jgi:DNA-binding IscR family transcriptional regulator
MICATEGETEMACERQVYCSANLVWERVRDSVAQALDSLTLQDLVVPKAPIPLQNWDADFVGIHPITIRSQERKTASV